MPAANAVPVAPVPPASVPAPVAPVVAPPKPATAPVISWDGSRISIDAENATLSDILLGIRARTGASIEMPPGVSRERVAVHLGPAPIREVIASLLYGTEFDYIIQAPDDDPKGLRRVILTARAKDDGDDTTVATDAPTGKPRMMKGWAAPGKRDFEVAHQADDDSTTQADSGATADSGSTTADPGTATTDSVPSTAQNSATPDSGTTTAATEVANTGLTSGDQSLSASRAGITTGQTGSSSDSPISQMEQNLQRMYEQRRQIQVQQNQVGQAPKTP
jgi:hypothetical protein